VSTERGNYGKAVAQVRRGGRGRYGHVPLVGITLFHGISDRDTAAAQINTQIQTIKNVVLTAAGADPSVVTEQGSQATIEKLGQPQILQRIRESRDAINRSSYASLWYDVVSPLYNEWNAFYADKKHWYDAFTQIFTSWEDYLSWADRVNALRDKVEAAGIKIVLPRLHELHKSVQEKVEETASDVWKIAKYGLVGALAIGGVFALSYAASHLRKGGDR
jgi:hypothetical protein